MDQTALSALKNRFGEKLQENISFSQLTTLEIGGPIKAFLKAETEEELFEALRICKERNILYLLIGGGSNILASDQEYNGLVIKIGIYGIKESNGRVFCKAGTPLADLVAFSIDNGLEGFQNLIGIPGTIGGAVYGDAGAYGHSIRDHISLVKAFNGSSLASFDKNQCQFGYRDSIFKKNKFPIIEIEFSHLHKDDPSNIKAESEKILQKRQMKYPPNLKCPGSFFKNVIAQNLTADTLTKVKPYLTPYGKIPAGALIEAVGGKDQRLGNIKIAGNHGNTFINLGKGTANDFYLLAQKYSQKVKESFGITLEPEVQLVNLPPL